MQLWSSVLCHLVHLYTYRTCVFACVCLHLFNFPSFHAICKSSLVSCSVHVLLIPPFLHTLTIWVWRKRVAKPGWNPARKQGQQPGFNLGWTWVSVPMWMPNLRHNSGRVPVVKEVIIATGLAYPDTVCTVLCCIYQVSSYTETKYTLHTHCSHTLMVPKSLKTVFMLASVQSRFQMWKRETEKCGEIAKY